VDEKINEKINDLINIVSSGGNYLLNIGPKADGTIIPFERQVLVGVGKWLNENGEAIYGTNVSSIAKQDWGRITTKNNKLYLHVLNFPENNKLSIDGLTSNIKKAYPLSDNDIALKSSISENGLVIYLSDEINKDKYVTVIVLEYENELAYTPPNLILPNKDGTFMLVLDNAEKYHSYSGHDYYSTKPTIVKMKWYLPGNVNDACEIDIVFSDQNIKPLNLTINNKDHLLAKQNSDENLNKDLMHTTFNHVNFHPDKMNEVELTLEDKNNPHTGLNIKDLKISIKQF
jgi:alpha-L-fucosidase